MDISSYFLLFIIYSNLGWLMEVTLKSIELKKFINRGFLIGPICPIYGYGCLLIIILLKNFTSNIVLLFFSSVIICSILEYLTSYIMEKLFKARWWDYSRRKYNINGRICLNTMIPFGLLGCLMMYVVNPFLESKLLLIDPKVRLILAITLFIIYMIDNILSFRLMFKISKTIKKMALDNTEEITKKVKEAILSKSYLYRRIIESFPDLKAYFKKVRKTITK